MKRRLFRRNNGQIAPFMMAIMVILLIAIMITVNIGKLSLVKTSVSNAADAGALASASAMATGLSHGTGNIGFYSDRMLTDWASTQATLLFCPNCVTAWVVYGAHVASQAALWGLAQSRANDVLDEAKSSAQQAAFSNAGIDEAKKIKKGESYADFLKRKSPFEEWMENKTYEDENTYSWEESLKYGQTNATQPDRTSSVKVEVDVPSWTVIPLPGVIAVLGESPCPIKPVCCCNCWCMIGVATTWGIASVSGDTDPVKVRVTRVKPGTNLGLWKTRYKTSSGGDISSYAEAEAYGGSVLPAGSDYDSQLTKTE